MATFIAGEPLSTEVSVIEVTQTVEKPTLLPGRHSFQLVVEDDAGNVSTPDVVEVIVRDTVLPTAVLDAPKLVQPGQSFFLIGKRSSDIAPGRVIKYEWTMLE